MAAIRPGFRPGTFITQPPPTPSARALPPTPSARGLPRSDRGLTPTPSARALPNLDELVRKRASEQLLAPETVQPAAGKVGLLKIGEEISLRFEPGPEGTRTLSVRQLDDGTFEVDCQSDERLARLLSRRPGTREDAVRGSWTPDVLADIAIGARWFLWGAGVGAFLFGAASAIRALRRA